MASAGLTPLTTPTMDPVVEPRSISLPLATARVVSMVGFAAIPILAVKLELTTALLLTGLFFSIASIVFWSKLPS